MNLKHFLLLIVFGTCMQFGFSQSKIQDKLQALDFLIGSWVGESSQLKDGNIIKRGPAYEEINYQLNQHIITIDLQSEHLVLHTIITYDVEDQTYYYQPFYKTGQAKYPAVFKDKQFIVNASSDKRFIFKRNQQGQLIEYGEEFKNSKWQVYFKDTFSNYN